ATLQEVADKLSVAMNIKFDSWPPNSFRESVQFTLSAREQPFWQIIADLARQQGFTLQETNNQLRLNTQSGSTWRRMVVSGPVAIMPQSIQRQRTADLQAVNGKELTNET